MATINMFYNEQLSYFATNAADSYIESRELTGEGRWVHAHLFNNYDTGDNYEVWVDKSGAELIVEPNTFSATLNSKGYVQRGH